MKIDILNLVNIANNQKNEIEDKSNSKNNEQDTNLFEDILNSEILGKENSFVDRCDENIEQNTEELDRTIINTETETDNNHINSDLDINELENESVSEHDNLIKNNEISEQQNLKDDEQDKLTYKEKDKNTSLELNNRTNTLNVTEINLIDNFNGVNIKNDEIGEKNIDSVKYSIEEKNIETSIEKILLKSTLSDNELNKYSRENDEVEEFNLSEEFNGDIEINNGDFKQINSNTSETSETEQQINESNTNQREIFKQIKEGINNNSATRNIQIMLKPQSLGKINLNLKFFNNAMHINVFVENENVEEILKQNLDQIAKTINPMGAISIGSIKVSKVGDVSKDFLNNNEDSEQSNKNNNTDNLVQKIFKTYYI